MDHLWKWVNSGKPIASLDRLPGIETNCVELDDYSIGYILSEHLLQNGHTRICFLSGSRPNDTRVMGFKTCLLDHGISLSESSVFPTEINLRSGYEVGLSVLKREGVPRPTAFICGNDLVAAGLYKAAHALGLRIPEDISVVGCDDIELASLLGPSLTTVNLDLVTLGERCAQLLLSQIEGGGTFAPQTIHAAPRLVIRNSVKRLGAAKLMPVFKTANPAQENTRSLT
jgi:LacI family xylobiose transport system transcriptional regulator